MRGKSGWYMDWSQPGGASSPAEQVFGAAVVRPTSPPTLEVSSNIAGNTTCATFGLGYVNAMDAYHGGGLAESFFDINRDGLFNEVFGTTGNVVSSIDFGIGNIGQAGFTGNNLIVQGAGINLNPTTDNLADVAVKGVATVSRRTGWREITN